MRYRRVFGYGLIAHLTAADMRHMLPGQVVDCFTIVSQWEMAIHGVKPQKQGGDWD